ncbi:MAG: hypothetical protein H0T47_02060 [Planctomycetaceae bacterium]|nr:hypothetical protein [Planctomycetaceae bacterium]
MRNPASPESAKETLRIKAATRLNPLFLIIGTLGVGYPDVTARVFAVYVSFLLLRMRLRR